MRIEYNHVSNFERRAEIIASLIPGLPHSKIIEVGARQCEMLDYLNRHISGIENAVAVDISEDCLQTCASKGFETLQADLNNELLPVESSKFDIAIATEIIEHLHHPYSEVSELRRVLKPDGRLLVTVPNVARLRTRLGLLFGKDPTPLEPPEKEDVHIREFTLQSISKLLNYHGFEIEDSGYIQYKGRNLLAILLKAFFPQLRTHIYIVARPKK